MEHELNKTRNIKCLESLAFSVYNPAPPHRRMVGDLFYLTVTPPYLIFNSGKDFRLRRDWNNGKRERILS